MHWFPMAAVANYHRVSVKTKEIVLISKRQREILDRQKNGRQEESRQCDVGPR